MRGIPFLLALALQATLAVAQPLGTAWLAEGKVLAVRGTALYAVSDGVKVLEGDIFATEAKGQVQLQFNDGSIVNAGPGTRVMVVSAKGSPELALAGGWLKVAQKAGAKNLRIVTPALTLAFDEATAVVQTTPEVVQVFLEAGSLTAGDRRVKAGEFYSFSTRERRVLPRPAKDFLETMPKHYRDPLPPLPDKVKGRQVEPRKERDVSYEDVAEWLKTQMPVRRTFVRRFMPRTSDPQFKSALVSHMRDHMEWDRILFPEKYEPKDTPAKAPPTGGKP